MPSPAPVPGKLVDAFLFPVPRASYNAQSFPGELIWIPRRLPDAASQPAPGSQMVPCLLNIYESSRFLIIYFHSNAEDLGICRWFCRFVHDQFQVHVLAVEYPGYGACPGTPTPEGVTANAHAALQFATKALKLPLDRILVFGRSLGTGPALELAARFALAGLVLVTPFLSVKEVLRSRIGALADFLEHDWFQNSAAIKQVRSPTLVIHGKLDDIVPVNHGEAIYQKCTARKGLVCPPDLSHNANITQDLSIFVMPMLQFFNLPECCFDELEVPEWVYKSSSPLKVTGAGRRVSEADRKSQAPEKKAASPLAAKHPRVRHRFEPSREYSFRGLNMNSEMTSEDCRVPDAKPASELREDLSVHSMETATEDDDLISHI